jgi:hypothetical protein
VDFTREGIHFQMCYFFIPLGPSLSAAEYVYWSMDSPRYANQSGTEQYFLFGQYAGRQPSYVSWSVDKEPGINHCLGENCSGKAILYNFGSETPFVVDTLSYSIEPITTSYSLVEPFIYLFKAGDQNLAVCSTQRVLGTKCRSILKQMRAYYHQYAAKVSISFALDKSVCSH